MQRIIKSLNNVFPSDARSGRLGSLEQLAWLAQCVGVPLLGFKQESFGLKAAIAVYGVTIILLTEFLYLGFEILHLILNWPSFDAFTHNASLSITHLSGLLKLLNTFWRLPELHRAVVKLKAITQRFVKSKEQESKFQQGEFENKVLLTIYASVIGLTGLAGIIMLILFPYGIAGERFPYCATLPQMIPYMLQLPYMGVSVFLLALQIVVIDFMNVALINHIRYQLDILMLSFEAINASITLQEKQLAGDSKIILPQTPFQSLKAIIQHHCLLIELRDEIQSIYSLPILLQFLTSLLVFGITGFRATVSGDLTKDMIIFLYCGCIFIQLIFYCWFGNEVHEKSKALTIHSFGSLWFECDQRFKATFLIFLLNTQRPFLFSGAGFVALALPTFTGILSRSYTSIAVLRQIYGK